MPVTSKRCPTGHPSTRKIKHMSLKVRYHDGRMQVLEADRYDSQTDYWRFSRDDQEIALIAKKSVESITNDDVPDPEFPAVEVTEMRHAPRTGAV